MSSATLWALTYTFTISEVGGFFHPASLLLRSGRFMCPTFTCGEGAFFAWLTRERAKKCTHQENMFLKSSPRRTLFACTPQPTCCQKSWLHRNSVKISKCEQLWRSQQPKHPLCTLHLRPVEVVASVPCSSSFSYHGTTQVDKTHAWTR